MRYLHYLMTVVLSVNLLSAYAATHVTQSTTAASPKTYISPTSQSQTTNTSDVLPASDVTRFTQALANIKQYYVHAVSNDTLFDNAIRGMLTGLDPHSDYLEPDDFAALKTQTSGEFAGLGLEVGVENGYIVVISPMDDTPAAKAGIRAGDYIVKVNNNPVMGTDLQKAVNIMRGPKGTTVKITLYHKPTNQLQELTLTRDTIKVQSIKSAMLAPGYGYIRIAEFEDPTMTDLTAALKALVKQNNAQPLRGLVLDLRNDPGGLLESAISVANAFLDSTKLGNNRLIVYTVGRVPDAHFEAHATPGDLLNGAPIVVLINEGTASAAEIVAGALQDQHRAILLGTNSFGKGSVQTVIPLDKDHAIKITTALYYTPNGRSIQAKGIHPDVYIPLMEVKQVPNANMINMATVKEADLSNHIGANTAGNLPNNPVINPTSKLLQDYQLQEALNLLKGLVVAERQQPPTSIASQ